MGYREEIREICSRLVLFRPDAGGVLELLGPELEEFCCDGEAAGEILRLACEKGWRGNLWHCFVAYGLLSCEDPYTLRCERGKSSKEGDSLDAFAKRDMGLVRRLLGLFDGPAAEGGFPEYAALMRDFSLSGEAGKDGYAEAFNDFVKRFSAAAEEDMTALYSDYVSKYGAGCFGEACCFTADRAEYARKTELFAVRGREASKLSDLVGYERQKKELRENTEAFVSGRAANNALLYGDAGTGKSTSVYALANEYADRGLRLIELKKSQYGLLPELFSLLKGRGLRFIILLDDLSFEENEIEYKELKAAMEGGAEAAPENVLIYATSNRRHLVRENWKDRSDMEHEGDIHRSDTMEEKLSLAGRFGLQVFFPNPNFEEYRNIVKELAEREEALEAVPEEELLKAAATWQRRRGNRSGRSARQFVNSLLSGK